MIYQIFKIKIRSFLTKIKYLNKHVGKHTYIASGVQFVGLNNIRIGEHCTIGENTIFNINKRDNNNVKLIIHDNSCIGRNNFFTVGKSIEVKSYCLIGNNCSFLGSGHNSGNSLTPYLLVTANDVDTITIGVNCWLGINVSIIGNVKIGHGSVIGANSVVLDDVPPFSLVVGNPARIIKRFNFELNKWIKGEMVSQSTYLDENIYIAYLKEKFGNTPIAFHASSSKMGNI